MLLNLLSAPNLIRQIGWKRIVVLKQLREVKKCYKVLLGKPKREGTILNKDMVIDKMIVQFLTTISLRKFSCYLLNQNLDNIAQRNH